MMTILFVENHPRFASITVKTFLSAHAVTVVPCVAAARQALSASSFDAVLVDYDLDDGKGAELVQEMQSQVNRAIIIAASSHAAGNQALLQAGADAVCSKMDFTNIESIMAEARVRNRG
jgi:DNA-binding response OmpR family regulator